MCVPKVINLHRRLFRMGKPVAIRAKRDHVLKRRLSLSFGNRSKVMDIDN